MVQNHVRMNQLLINMGTKYGNCTDPGPWVAQLFQEKIPSITIFLFNLMTSSYGGQTSHLNVSLDTSFHHLQKANQEYIMMHQGRELRILINELQSKLIYNFSGKSSSAFMMMPDKDLLGMHP